MPVGASAYVRACVRAYLRACYLPGLRDAINSNLNCERSPHQPCNYRGTKTIVIALNTISTAWLFLGGGRAESPHHLHPLKFAGALLSVTGTFNLTFLVRRARTPVASITQAP